MESYELHLVEEDASLISSTPTDTPESFISPSKTIWPCSSSSNSDGSWTTEDIENKQYFFYDSSAVSTSSDSFSSHISGLEGIKIIISDEQYEYIDKPKKSNFPYQDETQTRFGNGSDVASFVETPNKAQPRSQSKSKKSKSLNKFEKKRFFGTKWNPETLQTPPPTLSVEEKLKQIWAKYDDNPALVKEFEEQCAFYTKLHGNDLIIEGVKIKIPKKDPKTPGRRPEGYLSMCEIYPPNNYCFGKEKVNDSAYNSSSSVTGSPLFTRPTTLRRRFITPSPPRFNKRKIILQSPTLFSNTPSFCSLKSDSDSVFASVSSGESVGSTVSTKCEPFSPDLDSLFETISSKSGEIAKFPSSCSVKEDLDILDSPFETFESVLGESVESQVRSCGEPVDPDDPDVLVVTVDPNDTLW